MLHTKVEQEGAPRRSHATLLNMVVVHIKERNGWRHLSKDTLSLDMACGDDMLTHVTGGSADG
jgi:hypothetical protein